LSALEKTEDYQSKEKIKTLARCVQPVICSVGAYIYVRLLTAKTKELDEIRGSSNWWKVLETDKYKDRIDRILNEMKEATESFCVSSPYFIGMS
jgi:hypothetical protein